MGRNESTSLAIQRASQILNNFLRNRVWLRNVYLGLLLYIPLYLRSLITNFKKLVCFSRVQAEAFFRTEKTRQLGRH